jgi:hypothetical protein
MEVFTKEVNNKNNDVLRPQMTKCTVQWSSQYKKKLPDDGPYVAETFCKKK